MRTRQQGVALIEFALVLPLLLLLTLITTEFGRALYEYNTLTKAVRDSVRYLSIQTPLTHTAEATNIVVYGNPNPPSDAVPITPGLTVDKVSTSWQTAGSNPLINTVTVKISQYQFTPMILTLFGFDFNPLQFNDISATMRSPI